MFTANSMNCLCEALGMALPTNGTLLATSAERKGLFRRAAERIVAMVAGIRQARAKATACLPREIVTHDSIDNAMILDMAMGGSTNTVLHMLAIAREAGVPLRHGADQRAEPPDAEHLQGRPQQQLSRRRRAQLRRRTHDPRRASARGRPGLLHLDCPTVTGKTLGENIAAFDIRAATAGRRGPGIGGASPPAARRNVEGMSVPARGRPRSANWTPTSWASIPWTASARWTTPTAKRAGWRFSTATWRPKGAVVKTAGVKPQMLRHAGPAVIFEAETEAYEGIVNGQVKAGDVVIIRYEGPAAAPGCRRCSPRPRRSRAWAWTTRWPWSPTAAFPAARPGPASATSAPRRPPAARSD